MAAFHRFEDLHMTAASVSVDEDASQLDQTNAAKRSEPAAGLHPLVYIGAAPQTARTSTSSATISPASAMLSARRNGSNATQSTKASSTNLHVNEGQMRGSEALAEPAMAKASIAEQTHNVTCKSLEERICETVRAAVHEVMLEATAQLRATAAELQRQHAQCCGGRDISGGCMADWRAELQQVLEEFRNKLMKGNTFGPSPNEGEQAAATPSRWPRKASPQRDSLPKPESRDSSIPGRQRAATGDACTEEEIHWLVNNLGASRNRSEDFKSRVLVNAPASTPASASVSASSGAVSASVPRRSGCSPVDDNQKKSWPVLPESLAARRASATSPPPLCRSQPAIRAPKGSNLSLTTPPLSAYSMTPPLNSGQRLGGSLQRTARQQIR